MPTIDGIINGLLSIVDQGLPTNGAAEISAEDHRAVLTPILEGMRTLFSQIDAYLANQFDAYDDEFEYQGGTEYVVFYNEKIWLFISDDPQTGVTPGTNALVWEPISALSLAHFRNQDTWLDQGGDNPISAQTIKEFIDAFVGGELDLSAYIKKDGSVDFTGKQTGTRFEAKVFNQTTINTLTDGATISWDFDDGDLSQVTLGGNRTIAAPTNVRAGVKTLRIIQDGTGDRTVTWNAAFNWISGVPPVLNATAGASTFVSFYTDGTNIFGIGATEAFLTEALLKATARQFTKGQGLTNVALSIVSNETDIDCEDGNSFTLNMDEDTELQLPTNNRPQDMKIEVTNDGGNTLTFATGYRVIGDTPTTTDTEVMLVIISSFGNGTPWVSVTNQP